MYHMKTVLHAANSKNDLGSSSSLYTLQIGLRPRHGLDHYVPMLPIDAELCQLCIMGTVEFAVIKDLMWKIDAKPG